MVRGLEKHAGAGQRSIWAHQAHPITISRWLVVNRVNLQYIWKPRWLRSGRPAAQRRIGSEPKKRSKKKTDGRCHWPTWKGIICCSTGFCPLPCDAPCPAWNWGLGTLNAFYHFSRLGSWFSLHPINIASTDDEDAFSMVIKSFYKIYLEQTSSVSFFYITKSSLKIWLGIF